MKSVARNGIQTFSRFRSDKSVKSDYHQQNNYTCISFRWFHSCRVSFFRFLFVVICLFLFLFCIVFVCLIFVRGFSLKKRQLHAVIFLTFRYSYRSILLFWGVLDRFKLVLCKHVTRHNVTCISKYSTYKNCKAFKLNINVYKQQR